MNHKYKPDAFLCRKDKSSLNVVKIINIKYTTNTHVHIYNIEKITDFDSYNTLLGHDFISKFYELII